MTRSSRLKEALEGLAQSMERLAEAVARFEAYRAHLRLQKGEPYRLHGSPFGPGDQAVDVWLKYGQYTTPN